MDMILVKALPTLHNTVASTVLKDGEVVLNGAFMAFDRLRCGLLIYYHELLLVWNHDNFLSTP
jgi:hypothetical protein